MIVPASAAATAATAVPEAPPGDAPAGEVAADAASTWHQANQRYLTAAIGVVRAALERYVAAHARREANDGRAEAAGDASNPAADEGTARAALDAAGRAMPAPPALARLRGLFGLSSFEVNLLLLCAAVEFDAGVAGLCAAAQGDPARAYPTFSLGLAALPAPHWSALAPNAPLRRWRLLDVGAGPALTLAPLRVDERVLHYLAGVQHVDERVAALLEPLRPAIDLVPSQRAVAAQIAAVWSQESGGPAPAVIQLCGDETAGKRAIAGAACAALGLGLSVVAANALPATPNDVAALVRLWEREAALSGSALLVECDEIDAADAGRVAAVSRLVERLGGAVLVSCRERQRTIGRPMLTFDVAKPNAAEQRAVWHGALGSVADGLNGHIDQLVAQFNLGAQAIQSAGAEAVTLAVHGGSGAVGAGDSSATPFDALAMSLWDACRVQARPRLDDLAQRIEPAAAWDDLVLPEAQREILREIAIHVRQRTRVYERWGFAGKGARGLGISALFAGSSGTGKTMAAEVLAHELRLDVYRIDLSATVSKYIGETEKNLRRVFDAAEEGGAILLFDEADALFGKRSEVKDSHDRYANIEVGYLLQRMEAYRGLAILTTNLKNSLDTAFLRRIRFVVQFPFPDAAQRAEIWRRIFPVETPLAGVDVAALARLNVAGGNIRNIALNAAFLAAEEGEPVRMQHLLRAAHTEYAKLEKPLTEAEVGAWLTAPDASGAETASGAFRP